MNKNILKLSLICIAIVLLAPLAQAEGPSEVVTVWTDKPTYSAGQTGKLYITYNNIRDAPVTIRRITVVFEKWWAYINNAWVGNLTYEPPENERTITEHTIHVFEISFTVPSDGRATTTDADIKVETNLPMPDKPDEKLTITVAKPQIYMEQIVTLFTIQVVLIIVCTVILAATMFLSVRRPQIMWRKEEKAE